jgi:flavin reductase (DIM6/NTAB) family NADH-FMN oxidoreductase RutF
LISVAVIRRPGSVLKDTARNIAETKEFVVNMADVFNVDAVNQTSADYPPEVSEVAELGLTEQPSAAVRPPRLGESRIHFECRLHRIVTLGEPAAADLIIGEVVHVHIDDSLYQDGRIDISAFSPVSRLAGHWYATLGELFERPRPIYQPKRE